MNRLIALVVMLSISVLATMGQGQNNQPLKEKKVKKQPNTCPGCPIINPNHNKTPQNLQPSKYKQEPNGHIYKAGSGRVGSVPAPVAPKQPQTAKPTQPAKKTPQKK